jgi:hypothetical protein
MAETKKKANTKKDLEDKIAQLEAKLAKLSADLETKPAEAAKPAETKPAEVAKPAETAKPKPTLPKGTAEKPAETPKPAETKPTQTATFPQIQRSVSNRGLMKFCYRICLKKLELGSRISRSSLLLKVDLYASKLL